LAKIFFITGGTRSGKSSYAMNQALNLSNNPTYIATARCWDKDFEDRIQRHKDDRDERWTSIEEEKSVSQLDLVGKVVVIDCVTLWLTNFFMDCDSDIEKALTEFKHEINQLEKIEATFLIISNELGMGTHADTELGRKFTDLQGWANQYIAQKADKVTFVVSGIPMLIKDVSKD